MAEDLAQPDETAVTWDYVRLDQYVAPVAPTSEIVRKGWRRFWDRLRRVPAPEQIFVPQLALQRVPTLLLDRAASQPLWSEAVTGLDAVLTSWLRTDPGQATVQVVVGSPHGAASHAVTTWARQHELQEIREPSYEQILERDRGWLEQLSYGQDTPFVIPHLEHCYLRHAHGLELLRLLLDRVSSADRRCLIGCGSWAWAYLSRSTSVNGLMPQPWVLRAFDAERLAQWFRSLAARSEKYAFVFRQADNGRYVLADTSDLGDGTAKFSDFLRHVAAHTRGRPGDAWTVWRHSLRSTPDEKLADVEQDIPSATRRYTVWVEPWDNLDLPVAPKAGGTHHHFVLHTLLLHGGLPAEMIARLLPLSPIEVLGTLTQLQSAGLLEEVNERWQVSSLGYPAVRQTLSSEGFLTDGL